MESGSACDANGISTLFEREDVDEEESLDVASDLGLGELGEELGMFLLHLRPGRGR